MGSLISVAMMGGLALLMAKLTKQQYGIQRKAETQFEISALFNSIVRNLYNGEACNRTLGVGTPISDGRSIDYIRNEEGDIVFESGETYGNRLLQIDSMSLENTRISGTGGEVGLKVVLLKLSKAITGHNQVERIFPISVDVVAGVGGVNNLSNCYIKGENLFQVVNDVVNNNIASFFNLKAATAKGRFCTMMGGTYNFITKACSFAGTLPDPVTDGDSDSTSSNDLDSMRHFDPPIDTPEGPFCGLPEYICMPQSVHPSVNDCGIKAGSLVWNPVRYNRSACYIPDAAHDYQTATDTSCERAKEEAERLADPGNLATTSSTILPSGHQEGRIYCDPDCSADDSGNFTMRCRLYLRGKAFKCSYQCR